MAYKYQGHIPKAFFIFISQPMYHQYLIVVHTNIISGPNHKNYLCVSMNIELGTVSHMFVTQYKRFLNN